MTSPTKKKRKARKYWIALCTDKKALFQGKGIAFDREIREDQLPFKGIVIEVIEVIK